MEHENAFHANALEDSADGDRLVQTAVALGNHNALVGLNPLLVAFADADADTDGVSDVNVRKLCFLLGSFEGADLLLSFLAGDAGLPATVPC